MNILVVGNAYPPTYMGGESSHLFDLATTLQKRGHSVSVAHPAAGPNAGTGIRSFRSCENITVYHLCAHQEDSQFELLNKLLVDMANGLHRKGKTIDVIHCHSNKFVDGVVQLTQEYSVPLVSTVHAVHIALVQEIVNKKRSKVSSTDWVFYKADIKRQKRLCAASSRIVAISKAMAAMIVQYFDADPKKVRHIYNGIDASRLSNFPVKNRVEEIRNHLHIGKKIVILFAGRIEPVKGIKPLAIACKDLCKKYDRIACVFLGNGSGDRWLRSYLSDVKNVHFINWVSSNDITPYYRVADIVVVPSLIEPFGLVAVEAMACRTCVIASNADGLDEIVRHNIDGIKIPLAIDDAGDRHIRADEIYNAIETAICNPQWRQSLADQGVQRAKAFSNARMAAETETLYLEALAIIDKRCLVS